MARVAVSDRSRSVAAVAVIALLATLLTCTSAGAASRLYWTSPSTSAIGSAERSGTGVNLALLDTHSFSPGGIDGGVVSDGTYLYWPDPESHAIGRTKVDGTNVEPRFITGLPFQGAWGDSVRSLIIAGPYLFWRNPSNTIGRAKLDGSDIRPNHIASGHGDGLASDGTYLYFIGPDGPAGRHIGRANLDGTGINDTFIALAADMWVSEIAATASNLFWVGTDDDIWRANLNGTGQTKIVTTTNQVGALAANGTHIFWAEDPNGAAVKIQRATTSGASISSAFVTGSGNRYNAGRIAVDATSVYHSHEHAIWRAPIAGGALGSPLVTGVNRRPWSVAADQAHVYWAMGERYRDEDRTIRRASLSGVEEAALPTGDDFPRDLTIANGTLYWSGDRRFYDESYGIYVSATGGGAGKMAVDGSSLVHGTSYAIGDVAVDGNAVYLTRDPGDERDIFRSPLDLASAFTKWRSTPHTNAVATAGGFVYWVGENGGIDRQLANGTGLQTDYIPGIETQHLATDSDYLYWTDTDGNRIGRAKLDGSAVEPNFITNVPAPTDITVATESSTPPPPTPPGSGGGPTDPSPPVQDPAPTAPTPPAGSSTQPPSGSGVVTPPSKPKPGAGLRARTAKRGSNLVLSLTAVPNGTKLTVTWKPKRGKSTRGTYRVGGTSVKIKVPKKAGRYGLSVKQGAAALLTTTVTVR